MTNQELIDTCVLLTREAGLPKDLEEMVLEALDIAIRSVESRDCSSLDVWAKMLIVLKAKKTPESAASRATTPIRFVLV